MRIVIDISEETYNEVCWRGLSLCPRDEEELVKAIKKGTPLPEGHGRLYDEKAIRKGIKNPYQCVAVLDGLKLVEPIIEAESEDKA